MFRKLIEESKPLPDYSKSDIFNVQLKISAVIQDKDFIQFISRIYKEKDIELSIDELLLLNDLHIKGFVKPGYQNYIPKLLDEKIIEQTSRGKSKKYFLNKELYSKLKCFKTSCT